MIWVLNKDPEVGDFWSLDVNVGMKVDEKKPRQMLTLLELFVSKKGRKWKFTVTYNGGSVLIEMPAASEEEAKSSAIAAAKFILRTGLSVLEGG